MREPLPPSASVATSCVLAIALSACSGINSASPNDAGTGDGTTIVDPRNLPCDVDTLLAQHCRECHSASPKFGAPMALVTYGDLMSPTPSNPKQRVVDNLLERVRDDTVTGPHP